MKNCEYWQQLISRFLDGDLSPEEEAALWEHIAGCPDCAQAFEDFSQQTSVLRAQAVRPPVDLSRLVMARIKNGQLDAASLRRREAEKPVSHRLRPLRKLAIAACFVAVVAAGAVTGIYGRGARLTGGANSGSDAGAYLPEAQSDTIYVQLPENGAPAQVPANDSAQAPARDAAPAPAQTEADAPAQEPLEQPAVPEEAAAEAPPPAAEPMPEEGVPAEGTADAAPPAADTAPAEAFSQAEDAPEDGIMTIMEPAPIETAAPACQVLDGAGQPVGSIADEAALTALLTGESWQGETPAAVYTLTLNGAVYRFASDGNGALLWQLAGQEGYTLSPASLADLQALIVN